MPGSTKAGEGRRGTANGETRRLANPEPDGRYMMGTETIWQVHFDYP